MREIKFKFLMEDGQVTNPYYLRELIDSDSYVNIECEYSSKIKQELQYTGLKDKNGVDIYEYMELDNQFEVSFSHGSYILTNISNGDIMTLHKYIKDKNGQVKITKEYTKI